MKRIYAESPEPSINVVRLMLLFPFFYFLGYIGLVFKTPISSQILDKIIYGFGLLLIAFPILLLRYKIYYKHVFFMEIHDDSCIVKCYKKKYYFSIYNLRIFRVQNSFGINELLFIPSNKLLNIRKMNTVSRIIKKFQLRIWSVTMVIKEAELTNLNKYLFEYDVCIETDFNKAFLEIS